MNTKVCFKCGLPKPIDEFYTHPQTADGRLGKCVECCKNDVKKNYRKHKSQYQAYERKRAQLPHRVKMRTDYQNKHPEICNPLKRAWEVRNPEKKGASTVVNNAIRDGRLVRQTVCSVCGRSENVEAHHTDYSKPLDIQWLCKRHHWEADCVRREAEAVSFDFGFNVA